VIKLCFICLGNVIRSPLAEYLFKYQAEQNGVSHKYVAASAGTANYRVGEPYDGRMRRVAAVHGLHYEGIARQLHPLDLEFYDLLLVMDLENWAYMMSLSDHPEHKAKVHLLREFDPQGGASAAVTDPYYGDIQGFEEVYQVVERSVQGLLEALEEGRIVKI